MSRGGLFELGNDFCVCGVNFCVWWMDFCVCGVNFCVWGMDFCVWGVVFVCGAVIFAQSSRR